MESKKLTCVITGGAQGIGRGIANLFLSKGHNVVIADIDREAGEEFVQEQKQDEIKKRLLFHVTDVKSEASVKKLFETTIGQFKYLDLLINNAAISAPTYKNEKKDGEIALESLTLETWSSIMHTNLTSVFLCSKYAIPFLRSSPNQTSSIINIASTRALMSEADTEPYSASKGGVVALTHSLAISLAKHNIRVNCISPGWIDVRDFQKKSTREKFTPSPLSESDHQQHPVGRVGIPNDIAQMCYFLASKESAGFITGQNIVIDGGMTKKMIYLE